MIRKRLVPLFLAIIMLISLTITITATSVEKRTVRVGYFLLDNTQEIDENGNYSGYLYEYLQGILPYTNWECEFVQLSWSECIEQLQSGEIDMMGYVLKTPEREEIFGFADFYSGYSKTKLLVRVDDDRFAPNAYEDFNGMVIGTRAGATHSQQLMEFAAANNFTYNEVVYEEVFQVYEALEKGEIDAVCITTPKINESTRVVASFDAKPYYFVVEKGNTQLLGELNKAISQKKTYDPLFEETLRLKYYQVPASDVLVFSSAEQDYLASNPIVTVAVDSDYKPIEWKDSETGAVHGYTIEVLNRISQMANLEFEYVSYDSFLDGTQMLLSNNIDILSSVNSSVDNLETSDTYIDATVVLLGKPDFTLLENSATVIALQPRVIHLEDSIRKVFPNCEFKYFNTDHDAYLAVLNGKCDLIAKNIYAAQVDMSKEKDPLKIVYDLGEVVECKFLFNSNSPPELESIINKCIDTFTDANVNYMMITASMLRTEKVESNGKLVVPITISVILLFLAISLIHRLKKSRRSLTQVAYYDRLTGLRNIEKLKIDAKKLIEDHPNTEFTCVVFDICNFKLINDRFGNQAGYKLLCIVAEVSKEVFDVESFGLSIVAKLHTDTFAYIVRTHSAELEDFQITMFIEKCRKAVDFIDSHKLNFSIGRYISKKGDNVDIMLERAFSAHAHAKKAQSNVFNNFDDTFINCLHRRADILSDFDSALKNGEFQVYLQPQFYISKETPHGAEVLVRWIKNGKIKYYPNDFISVLEESGKVSELDYYLREQVCILLRKWLDKGIEPPSLSVNISRVELLEENFVAELKRLVQKYQVPPSLMHVEITETAYVGDSEQLIAVVKQLQDEGFCVEMDDFGSGYSSLNVLNDIPVNVLKLDMKFVAIGQNSARGGSILSSVVRMAQGIDLITIAEGVENREQLDFLRSIGCDIAQGYYFARPMPIHEFEELMATAKNAPKPYINPTPRINFLDSVVQDKLLFNTFLGGAAVLEYSKNELKTLRINDNFYKILRTTKEQNDAFKSNIFDRIVEKKREEFIEILEQARITDEEYIIDVQYHSLDEKAEPLLLGIGLRCLASDSNRSLYYVVISDLNKRKHMEPNALFSESEMLLGFQQLNREIMRYDIKEKLLITSSTYAKKHGIPTVLNNVPEVFLDLAKEYGNRDCDFPAVMEFYKKIINGEERGAGEILYIDENGKKYWELAEFVNIFDGDRNPLRAMITTYDITSQKEKEQEVVKDIRKHIKRRMRYDIKSKKLYVSDEAALNYRGLSVIENVPDYIWDSGYMDDEEEMKRYVHFFEEIAAGSKTGVADFRFSIANGENEHIKRIERIEYFTIFDDLNCPVSAVVTLEHIED